MSRWIPGQDGGPSVPPRFEDGKDRLTYLVAEYKIGVYLAIVAGTILIASGRVGLPSIPPELAWGLRWFAIGILPAMVLGKKLVVEPWIPDPRLKVLEVDLSGNVVEVDGHLCPRSVWEARNRGRHAALSPDEGLYDYVVTSFEWDDDLKQLSVEGANEELADPLEQVAVQNKVEHIYNDLLDRAVELEQLQATERMRRMQIEERVVNALIGAVEHGLELDTGATEEIVKQSREDEAASKVDADRRDRSSRTDEPAETRTLSDMVGDGTASKIGQFATDGGNQK